MANAPTPTTNVPQCTLTPTGFQAPQESAILAGTFADIDQAFGGGLNPSLTTPQGQLASSMAAIIGFCYDFFLYYTNQVDPTYAQGRMQDAIARIYFIERNPATPTVVSCTCSGLTGVTIPQGARALAEDGNIYICTGGGVIGPGGTVTLSFQCQISGPIACPSGSLNQIYQAVPGWDSITNPSDGVVGTNVESQSAFEQRRALSTGVNSTGALGSILGAVLAVPDVLDAIVIENDTNSPATIQGYELAANSIYVGVIGGSDAAVAYAIWSRKAPGCAYNGNTTVTVYDTSSYYSPPYPSYSVTFERPLDLDIVMSVVILNTSLVPSNADALIQQAVIDAFAGVGTATRVKQATELLASFFYAPITALGSWAQIVSIQIGSINVSAAQFTASISSTTMTVTAVASGTLAPNQTLIDVTGNLIAGTTIVSQSSGTTGGTGTYVISASQTLGSETVYSVDPDLFEVEVNLNQVPVIAAPNIIVTLSS